MNNKTAQLNVTFVPQEDRLIWRLKGLAGEEFIFYITRRFLKLFLPAIKNELIAQLPKEQVHKKSILDFEHKHAVSRADLSTPYQKPVKQPLGSDPILLTTLQIKTDAKTGVIYLTLGSKDKKINISLPQQLVHGLIHLLSDAAQRADWGLQIGFKEGNDMTSSKEKASKTRH